MHILFILTTIGIFTPSVSERILGHHCLEYLDSMVIDITCLNVMKSDSSKINFHLLAAVEEYMIYDSQSRQDELF